MVWIMLDSSVISNFISQQFVKTYNIPLKKKARPIPLLVIDSTPISMKAITYQTIACDLMLGSANEYCEMLTLDTILIVTYDVILSILWLNTYTLQIYWLKRKLVFISGYLLLALATIIITMNSIWIAIIREKELVEELPEAYKNYKYLFTEKEANKLLLYWPQNLNIKLIKGKTILY